MKLILASVALLILIQPAIAKRGRAEPRLEIYKRLVAEQMKDPASVQFKDISVIPDKGAGAGFLFHFCANMNTRNGFGGYTGFNAVYASIVDSNGTASVSPGGVTEGVMAVALCNRAER